MRIVFHSLRVQGLLSPMRPDLDGPARRAHNSHPRNNCKGRAFRLPKALNGHAYGQWASRSASTATVNAIAHAMVKAVSG
jgi:hypothetical protein